MVAFASDVDEKDGGKLKRVNTPHYTKASRIAHDLHGDAEKKVRDAQAGRGQPGLLGQGDGGCREALTRVLTSNRPSLLISCPCSSLFVVCLCESPMRDCPLNHDFLFNWIRGNSGK